MLKGEHVSRPAICVDVTVDILNFIDNAMEQNDELSAKNLRLDFARKCLAENVTFVIWSVESTVQLLQWKNNIPSLVGTSPI